MLSLVHGAWAMGHNQYQLRTHGGVVVWSNASPSVIDCLVLYVELIRTGLSGKHIDI